MKPLITMLLLTLATSLSAQTTRIVDANPNRPIGPNYYSTLQAAVNAATDDDIIVITPFPGTYDATLNKRLHFIGPGLDISRQDYRFKANIQLGISSVNASGSTLRGLSISSIGHSSYMSSGSSTIRITESWIGYLTSATSSSAGATINYEIRNSLVWNVDIHGTIQNSILTFSTALRSGVFRNNIAYGSFVFGGAYDPNKPSLVLVNVYNNIFLTNAISANHTSFTRNVFDRVYAPSSVNTAVSFTENITGEELDPRFIQGSLNELTTSVANIVSTGSFEGNYRLAANSPGKNYGTDGSDVGIYGGTYPFVQLDRGIVVLPSIRRLNVTGVVREGGEIRIEGTVSNASNN